MDAKVREQILAVRDTGRTNMFDVNAVQRINHLVVINENGEKVWSTDMEEAKEEKPSKTHLKALRSAMKKKNITEEAVEARFTIAVDRRFKKDGESTADFFNCVAFKGTADFMEKYCRKGQRYLFDGEIRNNNYEKDGKTVYSDQYIVNTVEFADGKAEEKKEEPNDFMAVPDTIDEELPFN